MTQRTTVQYILLLKNKQLNKRTKRKQGKTATETDIERASERNKSMKGTEKETEQFHTHIQVNLMFYFTRA